MKQRMTIVSWIVMFVLSACNFPLLAVESPTSVSQPTPVVTLVPLPTQRPPSRPEEAIAIAEPGPGSRLTSPIRVAGMSDPTFEQGLVVRIVLDDGTVLTQTTALIKSDWGVRGPYEVEIPFEIQGERNALIQVYDVSPRDGGIIHLNSVGIVLLEGGEDEIREVSPKPEAIIIEKPVRDDRVNGGVVHVEGIGIASFEGTLVVEVYDAEGNKVGQQSLIVDAPDMGQLGTFRIDVPYEVQEEGPGRLVVVDPLPVFDGVGHIVSVEVILAP